MLILHHAYLEVDRVGFCKTYLLPGKYAYSCKDRTFACLVRCKKKPNNPLLPMEFTRGLVCKGWRPPFGLCKEAALKVRFCFRQDGGYIHLA